MKSKKILAGIVLAVLLATSLVQAVAANPIVVDFSEHDFWMTGIAGGVMDFVNDGDRRVLFVEVVDGFNPETDPPDSTAGDPHGTLDGFDALDLDGSQFQYMRMTVKNESAAPYFEIHFASPSSGFAVATSVSLPIEPNSDYTTYVWNVPYWSEFYYPKRPEDVEDPYNWPDHWQGHIHALRLDFMYYNEPGGQARTGDRMFIEYIAFFETYEAARAWEFTPARTPASIEEARLAAEAEREAAAAEAAAAAESAPPADADDDADADAGEPADADTDEDAETPETTTAAPPAVADDDGNTVIIIIVIAAVVVVAIIVIVVVSKKKKD